MTTWYECKVKYEKIDQNTGKTKKVTEPYLIDAVTIGEAEERTFKQLEDMISGEFIIKSISRSNITDIFEYEHGESYFKATVRYADVHEDSGREKIVTNYMLVTADDTLEAYERIKESLKDMVVPFEIPAVQLSKICDVFPYEPKKEEGQAPA